MTLSHVRHNAKLTFHDIEQFFFFASGIRGSIGCKRDMVVLLVQAARRASLNSAASASGRDRPAAML